MFKILPIPPPTENAVNQSVIIVCGAEKKEFENRIQTLNSAILNPSELQRLWSQMAESRTNEYLDPLKPTDTKWMKRCKRIMPDVIKKKLFQPYYSVERRMELLNSLQCESHKDIMQYILDTDRN